MEDTGPERLPSQLGAESLDGMACKLAIVLHRMWVDGTDFRFGAERATAVA